MSPFIRPISLLNSLLKEIVGHADDRPKISSCFMRTTTVTPIPARECLPISKLCELFTTPENTRTYSGF